MREPTSDSRQADSGRTATSRSTASSQPSQPGRRSPAVVSMEPSSRMTGELEQLLHPLGALVHRRVDLVVVLVAAEREAAGERRRGSRSRRATSARP